MLKGRSSVCRRRDEPVSLDDSPHVGLAQVPLVKELHLVGRGECESRGGRGPRGGRGRRLGAQRLRPPRPRQTRRSWPRVSTPAACALKHCPLGLERGSARRALGGEAGAQLRGAQVQGALCGAQGGNGGAYCSGQLRSAAPTLPSCLPALHVRRGAAAAPPAPPASAAVAPRATGLGSPAQRPLLS